MNQFTSIAIITHLAGIFNILPVQYKDSMRIIGIDYGTKRVGVAVSDEAAQFALPFMTLKASAKLADEIAGIAAENAAKDVVLGESRDYNMAPNKIMPAILELEKELKERGLKTHFQPEFMTSVQAERLQGKNDKSDSSAAALILQSYLDTLQSRP